MLTFDFSNDTATITSPEGAILYSGPNYAAAAEAARDHLICRDSDLEIIQSTAGISLVEGYMPAALARRFQATEPGEFEIISEGEGFAEVGGWIPTDQARALAIVMRAAA